MTTGPDVVVGLGAAGAGDDAVGLFVARRLAAEGFPAIETSDASLLLPLFEARRRVILVDAWLEPSRAGEVVRFERESLRAGDVFVSSHSLSVADVLALARALYGEDAVSVEIVGIAIDRTCCVPSALSARAIAGIETALEIVRGLLNERR